MYIKSNFQTVTLCQSRSRTPVIIKSRCVCQLLHMIHVRVLVEIRTVYVRVCSQARRDPVYVQALSTRSCAYERMCTFSSRFMRNTAVRARRNLVCLVENTIPRRDLAGYRDWIENPRRDHLE